MTEPRPETDCFTYNRGRLLMCLARQRPQIALAAATGCGLFLLRVWSRHGALQSTDGLAYERMADSLLAGGGYPDLYWCPGYSALFALAKLLLGPFYQYGMVCAQYAIVLACGGVLARAVRMHVGRRLESVSFAFFVLSPHLINHASKLRPEILCMGFATMGIFSLLDQSYPVRKLATAAFWLALSAHVRNTSLGIAAAVGVWLFLFSVSSWSRNSLLERVRRCAVFSAVFAILILPWCAYATLREGRPVLMASNVGKNSRLGTHVTVYSIGRSQRDGYGVPERLTLLDRVSTRVQSLWVQWVPLPIPDWQSASRWLLLQMPMALLTPGVILLLASSVRSHDMSDAAGLCVTTAALYTVALACVYVRVRYRYPVDPAIYFAGISGLTRVFGVRIGLRPSDDGCLLLRN